MSSWVFQPVEDKKRHHIYEPMDWCHWWVFLKISMNNALSSLRRDYFLFVARLRASCFFNIQYQTFSFPTRLSFRNEWFAYEIGIQQGDQIIPAIFVLAIAECAQSSLDFNVRYLNEATHDNFSEKVYNDLVVLPTRLRAMCLELSRSLCELAILNGSMLERTDDLVRGFLSRVGVVQSSKFPLLGDLVGQCDILGTIHEKKEALERMTSKLK